MSEELNQDVFSFVEGETLLINKPLDWTSFNVVAKVRYLVKHSLGIKKLKVGHAGTLDPRATGLLIVCTGKRTKQINLYQDAEKEYTGTFLLGKTTPSFDTESEPDQEFETSHITKEMIDETVKKFIGEQEQIPPIFSAIKVNGKRAYNLARDKKEIKLEARKIIIREFEITDYSLPEIKFRVVCSKGTYIRSLAHDFGLALNSGAYLTSLCRTRIGTFLLEDAMEIEALETIIRKIYRSNP
jgi:tRNA pseudouridine55 synthase